MSQYSIRTEVDRLAEIGVTWAEIEATLNAVRTTVTLLAEGPAVFGRRGERDFDAFYEAAMTRHARSARTATPAAGPLATPRQVDFIVSLLTTRLRDGEGGGFVSTSGLLTPDGHISLHAVRALTRAQASSTIDSLKGSY